MQRSHRTTTMIYILVAALLPFALTAAAGKPSGDKNPPGAVTDLQAANVGFNTAVLTWTAPANDGYTGGGQATQYDIRIRKSTSGCGPFTMVLWLSDGATWKKNDPCAVNWMSGSPSLPGTSEAWSVSSIAPGTNYWVALRTADASGNWSAPSEPQLQLSTTSFPPAPWTAPWATEVVDACPLADATCRMGGMPRLGFDKVTGYPLMLYVKTSGAILASWTGSAWTIQSLPVVIDTGNFWYDFAIDPSSGDVTIASIVRGSRTSEVRFYRRTGTTWQTDTLASGTVVQANLGFAPSGIPTVAYAYSSGSTSFVRVAQKYGASWSTDTVASGFSGNAYTTLKLAFDTTGNPAVVFPRTVGNSTPLAFAVRNGGAWTVELPDNGAPGAPYYLTETGVAYDPIAGKFSAIGQYYNSTTKDKRLQYCERTTVPVTSWSCATVGTGFDTTVLAFDASGTAYLAYRQGNTLIMLVRAQGASNWAAEYIDWNVSRSMEGDLHFGPDGKPTMAYGSTNDSTGAANYSVSLARRTTQ